MRTPQLIVKVDINQKSLERSGKYERNPQQQSMDFLICRDFYKIKLWSPRKYLKYIALSTCHRNKLIRSQTDQWCTSILHFRLIYTPTFASEDILFDLLYPCLQDLVGSQYTLQFIIILRRAFY